MRLQYTKLLYSCALLATIVVGVTEARRVRVRPLPQEEEDDPTIQYYSADPREDGQQQEIVYITSSDQYNGLYGQQQANPRAGTSRDNYIQQVPVKTAARTKEPNKAPPVQTIRNYNKVNDDGSFTFGYEAADGSFKEETRGTDCVVRGKYGYVDPDGNKREFTYVSGNPCDPNAPKDDDIEDKPDNDREADSGPANYPTRPIRPVRPKPPVTLYQSNYGQEEDEQPEPEQLLRPVQAPVRRPAPVYITRQQYAEDADDLQYQRPRLLSPSTTPSSVVYKHSVSPINITPRPVTSSSRSEPATTYRPQLVQVAVTPRPSILYTKQIASQRPIGLGGHATTPTPVTVTRVSGGGIDFDAEFQKFQQENNVLAPTPSSLLKQSPKPKAPSGSGQIYSSELVFDPNSGQYNTQLYQTLPQSEGDFTLSQRIQPYVHNPGHNPLVNLQTLQQQSPLYRQGPGLRPLNQALYQQQQSELQFQNSAQLYAQQQKARSQQPPTAQQYYYVQPSLQQPQGFHGGQIDAFLRGHNIQFK